MDRSLTLNSEVHISEAMIDVHWSHKTNRHSIVANECQGMRRFWLGKEAVIGTKIDQGEDPSRRDSSQATGRGGFNVTQPQRCCCICQLFKNNNNNQNVQPKLSSPR